MREEAAIPSTAEGAADSSSSGQPDSSGNELTDALETLPELEGTLDEGEPQRLVRTIRAVLERHSGPLPHPSILEGYRAIEPTSVQWDTGPGEAGTGASPLV